MTLPRRILGVTGSRAEFGLLSPVFRAIAARSNVELLVAVAGSHLLPPARTRDEVASAFSVAAEIEMQVLGRTTRHDDAIALGHGTLGFAKTIDALRPDAVLVLGDRIEALAAASAAAIAGVRVVHIHGGDRAEGIADESMRHAMSKLAHLHCAATKLSAERLRRMGEDDVRIHVVGSPALDGIDAMPPLDDAAFSALGSPEIVAMLHPTARDLVTEERDAASLFAACAAHGRTLILHPNADPGRDGVMKAIEASDIQAIAHLPRTAFVGLLRRAKILVGNSSAGLIEAAATRTRVVNVGSRQAGRERASNVLDEPSFERDAIDRTIEKALGLPKPNADHPFGDGSAGSRIADLVSGDAFVACEVTKRNSF